MGVHGCVGNDVLLCVDDRNRRHAAGRHGRLRARLALSRAACEVQDLRSSLNQRTQPTPSGDPFAAALPHEPSVTFHFPLAPSTRLSRRMAARSQTMRRFSTNSAYVANSLASIIAQA